MRKIIVVSDPEFEVGFEVLANYCRAVQELFNPNETVVLPIWPSGKIEIIDGNKEKVKLLFKTLNELIEEFNLDSMNVEVE